jgi:hypothetical protein
MNEHEMKHQNREYPPVYAGRGSDDEQGDALSTEIDFFAKTAHLTRRTLSPLSSSIQYTSYMLQEPSVPWL